MAAEDEVRQASRQFYAALNRMVNGDAHPLSEIWSHSAGVTTLHPTGGRQVGWAEVWEAWEEVAQVSSDGKVEMRDQLIRVSGDVAYEIGVENAEFKIAGEKVAGEIRVTNIYQKEDGTWKIVHHHTDLAPAMVEVISRL